MTAFRCWIGHEKQRALRYMSPGPMEKSPLNHGDSDRRHGPIRSLQTRAEEERLQDISPIMSALQYRHYPSESGSPES